MQIRVYYEDTDAGGIVYHSKYLNFCERARSEIFFTQGKSPIQGDFHFVVKNINADFISSAKLGDDLIIETKLKEIKRVSLTMNQIIFRKFDKKEIFKMDVNLVCLKGSKISKIPNNFLNLLSITLRN